MKADYEWQRPYVAAVLETDRTKLPQHVAEAHEAIRARMTQLSHNPPARPEELEAIGLALKGLKLLSKEAGDASSKSRLASGRGCRVGNLASEARPLT
jgi:hypothetical protein